MMRIGGTMKKTAKDLDGKVRNELNQPMNKQVGKPIFLNRVPSTDLKIRAKLSPEGAKRYQLWKKLNEYQGDNMGHNFMGEI